jgi:hypothetical protein
MAVFFAALLVFFVSSAKAEAQSDWWEVLSKTPERLIGLLDLPDVVQYGCGPAPTRATARTFAAPSQNARPVATIYWLEERERWCGLMIEKADGSKEELPTLESGYEIPAAVVFERRGPWFRIRLNEGSAWIRRDDPEDFLAYPEVLREHLSHTMPSWNGILRATPALSGRVIPLSSGWKEVLHRQPSIQYLGSQKVGSELWLHIRLIAKPDCGQIHEGVSDVEGWIPAYHPDRSPSAWFASRGC